MLTLETITHLERVEDFAGAMGLSHLWSEAARHCQGDPEQFLEAIGLFERDDRTRTTRLLAATLTVPAFLVPEPDETEPRVDLGRPLKTEADREALESTKIFYLNLDTADERMARLTAITRARLLIRMVGRPDHEPYASFTAERAIHIISHHAPYAQQQLVVGEELRLLRGMLAGTDQCYCVGKKLLASLIRPDSPSLYEDATTALTLASDALVREGTYPLYRFANKDRDQNADVRS